MGHVRSSGGAISIDHRYMSTGTRSYQFTIAFDVEADHPAYDDPEWAADAASGALSNEYGLVAIHTDLRGPDRPVIGAP